MKKDKDFCSYGMFLTLLPMCIEDNQQKLLARLRKQSRPQFLCGASVPESLNVLSYGKLEDLQDAAAKEDPIKETAKVILGINGDELLEEDVNDVFGFSNFVTAELKRINKMFASIKPSYSAEEKAAGVESLDFGAFGVLDWYAQRMHIVNQNDVREIAWVRIYQCMKNDNEKNEFERRLHKIYTKKK